VIEPRKRRPRGEGAIYFEPAPGPDGVPPRVDADGLDEHGDRVKGRFRGEVDLGRGPDGRRQRRRVSGPTRTAVAKRMRELRIEAAKGVSVVRRPPTVAQLAREWLAKAAPTRRQASTMSRLTRRVEEHVIPGVGQRRVDQLRPEDVEAWLSREAVSGQSLRTIQDYRGDLRQILGWAERRRLVTWNAATQAELPLNAKPSDPKRSLTLTQRERLYAALDGRRMESYFIVLGELGLRPQEADALPWTAVDLDTGVVSILWAMKRGDGGVPLGIGEPKTLGSRRKLRLTSTATLALARRKTQQAAERLAAGPAWSRDERWANLVFTSEIGTPVYPSNMRRALRAAIRRANDDPDLDSEATPDLLIPVDFTPYEFGRHTTASLAVDAGATPYEVADLLGHTTTRMLDRHYRHKVAEIVDTAAKTENRGSRDAKG
jgi:integrase